MEIIVEQVVSRTHCIGFDSSGRQYLVEMPNGFYYLKGKKLVGLKVFKGDTRCLVNIETDGSLTKAHLPKESEYVYC